MLGKLALPGSAIPTFVKPLTGAWCLEGLPGLLAVAAEFGCLGVMCRVDPPMVERGAVLGGTGDGGGRYEGSDGCPREAPAAGVRAP